MTFHVLTLFPEFIDAIRSHSIIKRAVDNGLVEINSVNIRDYTRDKHGSVDDYPYGGGAGMVIKAEPVFLSWKAVFDSIGDEKKIRTVYMSPQGKPLTQDKVKELLSYDDIIILCGHYEGIDERVLEEIVDEEISSGDYVLTGGEIPAMTVIDSVSRLIPGVLHNEISGSEESFENGLLEYPQYTRPKMWHEKEVPDILLSGDHKKVDDWRKDMSIERTKNKRPDLYGRFKEKFLQEE